MKPQYLTRMESGAIRAHLSRALAAAVLVRHSLHPACRGDRIDVEESLQRVAELRKEAAHLFVWLNSIKKGNVDGTDLTAHL